MGFGKNFWRIGPNTFVSGWRIIVLSAFAMALPAASAGANTGDIIAASDPDNPTVNSGWQAGTCTTDIPTCSVDTKTQFFETATGHPQVGFTQFLIKEEPAPVIGQIPVGNLKTVRVDLPRGLSVNPQASIEQCELDPGESPSTCLPGSKVGESIVTATNPLTGLSLTLPPADVFNIDPVDGEPARFGLSLLGNDIFLEAGIAWEGDYHEYFTIDVPMVELGIPGLEAARILKNRLVFNGRSGDGTFITAPSTCFDPEAPPYEQLYSTYLRADSYEIPDSAFPSGSSFLESPLPEGTGPKECDGVPYGPSLSVDPGVAATDSPSGATTVVAVPHILGGSARESSQTKRAVVTLPLGMGLNPSAANGLVACTDAQFGKGTRNPVACPPASKVGIVAIDTPPLPPNSLTGDVYVGQQLSRDPASGDAYRIFVAADSARYGISARLVGNVRADPRTGQLTAVFNDQPLVGEDQSLGGLPQVPFSSFKLDFVDGPKAPLTSPPTCGPNESSSELTPWSGNAPASPPGEFALTTAPGGAECAKTMAGRPFAPGFAVATAKARGGAYSPFTVELTRRDGEQELKATEINLPPGVTAKLAGVKYCPEPALATAAANSGAAEAGAASCPSSSLVGTAVVHAGTGPEPLQIAGKAFLAGPHNGAPLSLAIVTPATAGPFDLGSVVVRVALFVQRETAQVQAVSDPIPHVFGGALLDVRMVSVKLDRPRFSLNPTNCSPLSAGGALRGGGVNPVDPAGFSSYPVSAPFKVNGCEELDFKPKIFFRLFGKTRRAQNPKLRAVLKANESDANIGKAVVTLPKGLILDQSNIAKVCTRVQFAANDCPKKSVYGFARAFTPLLDKPLEGPVRLRSSNNLLPDLVASLNGQIDVDLVGKIDTDKKDRIRNSFRTVPDVPVSKFVLVVRGGKKGLLTNSRPICGKGSTKLRAVARFTAQNGKKSNHRPKLRRPCEKRKRGGKK